MTSRSARAPRAAPRGAHGAGGARAGGRGGRPPPPPPGRTTFVFATHNVREAVLLADRVFVMSAAPGRLLEEFRIDATRPRTLDDVLVARVVSEIHDLLIRQVEEA